MIEIIPEHDVNPVDMYIRSLSNENSMSTMRGALCGTARLMAREGMISVDPDGIDFETVRQIQWHKLTNPQLDKIRGMLLRHYQLAGAHLKMAAIKGVLERAARAGMIDPNTYFQIKNVDKIRVARDEDSGRAMTGEEIEKILAACDADPTLHGRRDKALLAVMVFAGPRRNEVVRLNISDYSPEDGSLYVRFGKSKKRRHIYLGADGREIVEGWIAILDSFNHTLLVDREDGPLFPQIRKNGKPNIQHITPESVRLICEKRSREAELWTVRPHDCRRTFVTRMLEEGVDPFLVQVLAGHDRPQTTQLYDKRGPDSRRAAVERINISNRQEAE
jgi:integrase/recombinase XerD